LLPTLLSVNKRESILLLASQIERRTEATRPLIGSPPAITATVSSGHDLIKRAQEGDSDAFGALFQMHRSRIYSVCLRMTSNAAEAEDLTQDAFLQAFRKIARFRGDSAFSTWLHRIAVNTVLMHFRKNSLCQVSLDEPYGDSEGSKVRREYGTRDKGLAGCVDRLALTRAMKELPPGYRTIFLLHEIEGYEHQEIAEMLGCSVGNSKSQLYKAKLRFRELLAPSAGPNLAARNRQKCTKSRAKTERASLCLPASLGLGMAPAPLVTQLIEQPA
jgi:RNA polymerase sigma-70 factor (ECF subfamily)